MRRLNVGLMPRHRLRRWPNNKPTLSPVQSAESGIKQYSIPHINPFSSGTVFIRQNHFEFDQVEDFQSISLPKTTHFDL